MHPKWMNWQLKKGANTMNIDYNLLVEQKNDLLSIIYNSDLTNSQIASVDGVIALINSLQDDAVNNGMSEYDVYGDTTWE